MEFRTDQFVVTVVGIMITLILVTTVMIPTFSGIERQMVGYENNYDAASYASVYTPGRGGSVEIVVDSENDTATVNGTTVAIPMESQNGIIAASDMVQVVYTHTIDHPSGSLYACINVDRGPNNTQGIGWRYIEYDEITITDNDENPNYNIHISLKKYGDTPETVTQAELNSFSSELFYISDSGTYGLFAPEQLKTGGVSYNDRSNLLGVIKLPRANDVDAVTGLIGTYTITASDTVSAEGYVVDRLDIGHYTIDWYDDISLDYTVTDHGAYDTLNITRVTVGNTSYITGFWLFAPIEYTAMEAAAHAGIMMTILWLLPVLVVLGTMIVTTRMMEWELPVIGRDRSKER